MINYYEAGSRTLSFSLDASHPRLTPEQKTASAVSFQASLAKNPRLFNGQQFSCNSFSDGGNNLQIGVNRVDYATYKWARGEGQFIPGTFAMGNCIFIFDPDRQAYIFLQRSQTVAFDQGKISAIGGVIDYADLPMADFLPYVQAETVKEVYEEVQHLGKLRSVGLLGLYHDTQTNKVEFAYSGVAHVLGVRADESVALLEVTKPNLPGFFKKHLTRFEASTQVHLDHLASKFVR